MNTRFLETFVWLARLGNFSKTAEKLHATQPAISSRINTLEETLGVELYIRGSRPLELTPEGKQVLVYAERIYELERELRKHCVTDAEHSLLKVGVIEIVTVTWLTGFIEELSRLYEGIVLEITTGVHGDLIRQLLNNELDMVISIGPVAKPDITNLPLCSYALHWVASPHHFKIEHELTLADIAKLPIILTKPNSSIYPVVRDALMSYGMDYVFSNNQKVKFDCVYSLTTAVHLAKEGIGVMPLMPAVISEELRSNTLCVLNVSESLPSLHLNALYRVDAENVFLQKVADLAQAHAREFCEREGKVYTSC